MTDGNHSHSRRLFDPRHARPVTVLGAGSVGSQVVLELAKCGATDITVYDNDTLGSHNLSSSMVYGRGDVGRYKVAALRDEVHRKTGIFIEPRHIKYVGQRLVGDVVCCVDDMDQRVMIWQIVRNNPNIGIMVDTRTLAHYMSIFAIRPTDPEDVAYYEQNLYPTAQAKQQTCGIHGIVYGTAIAASLAVRALTSFWTGVIPRRHERVLLANGGTRITFPTEDHADGG